MATAPKTDESLLTLLACGATVEQAAKQTGFSARTIHRRLEDFAFQARLEKIRCEILDRSASMLTAAGIEAVRTLVELQKPSHPAMVRLNAAKSVLDLGVKLRSLVEVEGRIRDLESRIAELPPNEDEPCH
ncbi:MAG: hypothetical protein ACRC8S_12025 [Fimbriiglobus sp.]